MMSIMHKIKKGKKDDDFTAFCKVKHSKSQRFHGSFIIISSPHESMEKMDSGEWMGQRVEQFCACEHLPNSILM